VTELNSALQAARDHDVTVVNSSGDLGVASNPCPSAGPAFAVFKGVNLLDWDLLTLAAGGTSLQAYRATGAYIGETVWNIPAVGGSRIPLSSGGGFSQVFPGPPTRMTWPATRNNEPLRVMQNPRVLVANGSLAGMYRELATRRAR
jgi:hypothetical protein